MPKSLAIQSIEKQHSTERTTNQDRMSQDELRMAALGIVLQLPLHQEDAFAILDYARLFATECLFKIAS